MLAPERRTRADLIVAAVLAAAVAVAGAVIWLGSDARGTTSITWDEAVSTPPVTESVPDSLTEVWRAPSGVTTRPVVSGGTVVTADGDTVTGRDPETGHARWSYRRDRPLCAAAAAWGSVVAVYRDPRGCGQVTALDADSGARGAQRSSDTDDAVRLVDTGNHLIAFGDTRLEMWRSDLVRTVEYGRVDAPVNPGAQPRSGCRLQSADADRDRLAVLELCPGEDADRLTLLAPTPEDGQKPEEYASTVLPDARAGAGARIVAVAGDRTAVFVPAYDGGDARIEVFDGIGTPVARHELPAATAAGVTASAVAPAERHGDVLVWWTGTDTVGLGTTDLAPRWTVPGTVGLGTAVGGSLLLPVPDGLVEVDPATGQVHRSVPVARGTTDSVSVAVLGDTIVEQRGDELVALRP